MNICEIEWKDGNKYKDEDGEMWEVHNGDLYDTEGDLIDATHDLSCIVQLDFTLVVDWSKVEVDTPVWVSNYYKNEDGWKMHFAKFENGKLFAWDNGRTSHTTTITTCWKTMSLTNPKEV